MHGNNCSQDSQAQRTVAISEFFLRPIKLNIRLSQNSWENKTSTKKKFGKRKTVDWVK